MGWVERSRLRRRPASERPSLAHPVSTLVIGLIGGLFFFGLAILSNTIARNPTSTLWTTLAFVGFGLMSVPIIADYFFARHRVSDQGIEYGRMFGRGSLRWSKVRSVRFAPGMKWFVLESNSGTKVRISAMLMGPPEFARLVLLHVPGEAIDPDTRTVLQETRRGRPPGVWR